MESYFCNNYLILVHKYLKNIFLITEKKSYIYHLISNIAQKIDNIIF